MLEAIDNAKSQIERAQLVRENKREFLTFIQKTRASITELLSPMEQLDENNYGVSIPSIEGFFLKDIDAMRDLHIPDAAGYSVNIFIGREKVGAIGAWINAHLHYEPRVVVDVAVEHKPSHKMVTNQVFIIHRYNIDLWDRINREDPEILPCGQSPNTQLITDVLDYAAKHPKALRGGK